MSMKKEIKKAAEATDWNPIKMLGKQGVRSGHAYTAGLATMGLSVLSWALHKNEDSGTRGGLHLGGLATCLLLVGVALKHEE